MRSRILRGLGVIGLFAVLGPLIGLVVLAVGLGVLGLAGGEPDGYLLMPIVLLYGSIFAHYFGLKWALIAGGTAVTMAALLGYKPWWGGLVAGVFSFALALAFGASWMPAGTEQTVVGKVIAASRIGYPITLSLVHVLSAGVCWMLARRVIYR